MAIIRFGASCDVCQMRENDYLVETIRECEDCGEHLCEACALAGDHVKGKDADMDQSPTWREA